MAKIPHPEGPLERSNLSLSTALWLVLFSYYYLILSFTSTERMRIKCITLLFLQAII